MDRGGGGYRQKVDGVIARPTRHAAPACTRREYRVLKCSRKWIKGLLDTWLQYDVHSWSQPQCLMPSKSVRLDAAVVVSTWTAVCCASITAQVSRSPQSLLLPGSFYCSGIVKSLSNETRGTLETPVQRLRHSCFLCAGVHLPNHQR